MATGVDIADVRQNTNEPTEDNFTNIVVGDLIDEGGVNYASAVIWRKKAAVYAPLVNVSEAGASHAFGDLQKKALDMAALYESLAGGDGEGAPGTGRTRVHLIERD